MSPALDDFDGYNPLEFKQRLRQIAPQESGVHLLGAEPPSALYVFFSYDLVNSTRLKASHPHLWPLVTNLFYLLVREAFNKTTLAPVHVWKYVGDEVLLYKRVSEWQTLYQCLPQAHRILRDTEERLKTRFPTVRAAIGLKTAVWCARVYEIPPQKVESVSDEFREGRYRNILLVESEGAPGTRLDFLGPDIDVGFRIADHALRSRVVVSAGLAELLYRGSNKNREIEKQLKIVAYEKLKGIWNGRPYPIIWYESTWLGIGATFQYDEPLSSNIAAKVVAGTDGDNLENLLVLEKIFRDLNLTAEVDRLEEALSTPEADAEPQLVEASNVALEVHCVAVCFAPDGKILVARRSASKRTFPQHLEFGCGQLQVGETWGECLRRAYLEDFGVRIEIPDTPIPVSSYLIDRGGLKVPGLIFVASIPDPQQAQALRHEEIAWIDPLSYTASSDSPCVPGFATTIQEAFEIWRRRTRTK